MDVVLRQFRFVVEQSPRVADCPIWMMIWAGPMSGGEHLSIAKAREIANALTAAADFAEARTNRAEGTDE